MTRAFVLVWLCGAALALLFSAGHLHLTDEEITVAAGQSLRQTGHIPAAYHFGLLTLAVATLCANTTLCVMVPGALAGGLVAALMYYFALCRGLTHRRALAAALLVTAGASLLVWSDVIKDELYAVAALAGVLAAGAGNRPRRAALCLALVVLAKPALLVAALPLAFAVRGRRAIFTALLAIAAAVALVAADNFSRFGALTGGYQPLLPTGQPQDFSFPVWLGFTGHLFSPLRSIFLYNPFLLLILPIAVTRLRRRTITRLELCAAWGALAYLLLISSWTGWEGEVGYANRLALPVVILAAVFLPAALRTASRPLVILLLAAGFLINLPGSAWDYANYYQLPEHQRELVFEIRPQPLSAAAFRQTGEMFALGYRALLTGFPLVLNDYRTWQTTSPEFLLDYAFWLRYPDIWPVYRSVATTSIPSFPLDTSARRQAVILMCLPYLAVILLFLFVLFRLWRLPPPNPAC